MGDRGRDRQRGPSVEDVADGKALAPGRRTLTQQLGRPSRGPVLEPGKRALTDSLPVQRKAAADGGDPAGAEVLERAAAGVSGASAPLPHGDQIQRAFGRHDVGGVRAQVGGPAADASRAIGANAYARGEQIAFAAMPDMHTAAHEAAHVVQQRRGVEVGGGVGRTGDAYEQHADRVADLVVAGQSAEGALDAGPSGGGSTVAVQRDSEELTAAQYIDKHEASIVVAAHNTAMEQPFASDSVYAKLTDVHAFAVAALKFNANADIRRMIAPDKLEEIVDRIRLHGTDPTKGPPEWMESVGTTIGAKLAEKLQESLTRMLPRYVDARFQVLLAFEAKNQSTPKTAPEPEAGDIVGARPIDRDTAAALCTGCIELDAEAYRTAHPDGKPVFRKPKPVTFTIESATQGAYWIRVTTAEPATAEDVAFTLFGAAEQAFEITGAHPLFGFTHANKLVEPHRGDLVKLGEDIDAERDPNEALQDPNNHLDKLADEEALAQSAGAATGASKDQIVQKMRLNLGSLDEVIALATTFGLADKLAGVRAKIDARSQEMAKPEKPFAEVAQWDGQATLQTFAIQRANFGLAAAKERLHGMTKGMGDLPPKFNDIKLPDYVKAALLKVATAFVDGTALCDTPAAADSKLSEAEKTAVYVTLDLLDGMLNEITRVLASEAKDGHSDDGINHKGYEAPDAKAMAQKEVLLRKELARVRVLLQTNPEAAGTALKDLAAKIQDASSEAEIIGNIDELDRLWEGLRKAGPRLIPPAATRQDVGDAAKRTIDLQVQCDGFVARWKQAYKLYKDGDKDGAKKIIDALKGDAELPVFLGKCNQLFKDSADMAVVTGLVLLFGITIVTMGVGAWVEGVAAGLELGTGATILAVSGAEAVTFVALSQAFLDSDHSVGHIATELVFNFAMFSALRRFSKFIEAANMGKALKVGLTFTGQTLISTAAGLAKTEIETLVRTGKSLTEAQVKQICLESVVQAVALTLVSAGFKPIMEELTSAGKGLGTSIKIANERAGAVEQLTNALDKTSPPDQALAAIKAHREWGEAKLKAFEALEAAIEAEKTNPPKKGESVFDKTKLRPEQIATLKQSIVEANKTMKAAEAILTLEPTGPDTFNCPKDRIGKVLADLGGNPLSTTEDPVTKLKSYKVQSPDGRIIKIVETDLGPNAGGTGGPKVGPELDVAHLPESSQSVARWQTDGINHDNPKVWDTPSKDGRTFKDVYAEWMKQPERIRKKPDGTWEPVLPKDCPQEFAKIFDAIVARGNITLTTQGEANAAKLKEAGIDLTKLDPLSPEYLAQRDKIIGILGEPEVKRWEASMTKGDPAVGQRVNSVVPPEQLAALKKAFPDCEIVVTGSMTQTGKPLTGPKGIQDIDLFLIVPEGTKMENRIAMEKRAAGMKLATTPEFQKAGGPAELSIDAKAMLPEEYMGVRTVDPGGRNPLGDMRIDDGVPQAQDTAKRYGVSNDAAELKTWEALFKRDPVEAAKWANALAAAPGLAGRLLAHFGEAAAQHFKPTGNGTLSIRGHVEITAEKLAQIKDADLPRLDKLCETKGPVTDYEYFEGSESKTKPGYRLRFPSRLAERAKTVAGQVLVALGIDPANPPDIFKNMTPDDQSRMWDLAGEGDYGNSSIRKQASKWAMSKGPKAAREFVALFQLYAAEISRRTTEIVDDINARTDAEVARQAAAGASVDRTSVLRQIVQAVLSSTVTSEDKIRSKAREKAITDMDAASGSGTVGGDRADKVLDTNLKAQTGDNAPGRKDIGMVPTAELEAKVKAAAGGLSFANPYDAAYHAHKHAMEMASPPTPDQEMVVYLQAARETIKNGSASGGPKPAQTSAGRSLAFVDGAGNKCIVYVGADGQAAIATYMPSK